MSVIIPLDLIETKVIQSPLYTNSCNPITHFPFSCSVACQLWCHRCPKPAKIRIHETSQQLFTFRPAKRNAQFSNSPCSSTAHSHKQTTQKTHTTTKMKVIKKTLHVGKSMAKVKRLFTCRPREIPAPALPTIGFQPNGV